jgi:hypothetical protein
MAHRLLSMAATCTMMALLFFFMQKERQLSVQGIAKE